MGLSNKQKRTLRSELVKLYPTIEDSKLVLQDADIPTTNIAYNNSPKLNWNAIINETQKHDKIMDLINIVLDEYPQNQKLNQIKKELESDSNNVTPIQNPVSPEENLDQQISLLKRFVAVGKFEDVLTKLLTISASVSSDYENSVINISGRYYALKQKKTNGTISSENAQLTENQIRMALSNTISNLKSEVILYNKLAEFNQNVNQEISNKTIRESLHNKQVQVTQSDEELEKVIGNKPNFVYKSWFLKALTASDAVGRIFLKRMGMYVGTGFLVKDGYLLSNQHVIEAKADLEGSFIEFNFSDESNTDNNIYRFNFDPTFYHSSPNNTGDIPKAGAYDYALVKLLDNGKIPLKELGHLSFEKDIEPIKDDPVNIIQHPGGLVQQFSLTANEVIDTWEHYLYYKADTKGGSSGSPVFNQNWKVVALHHAGQNEKNRNKGLQIDKGGTIVPANRGILIKYIINDLAKKGVNI